MNNIAISKDGFFCLAGTIEAIGETNMIQSKTDPTKGFKTRSFVVVYTSKSKYGEKKHFPEFVVSSDAIISRLDNFSIGDEVKVTYQISGIKSTKDGHTRYFNKNICIGIEAYVEQAMPANNAHILTPQDDKQTEQAPEAAPQPSLPQFEHVDEDFREQEKDNDLPF